MSPPPFQLKQGSGPIQRGGNSSKTAGTDQERIPGKLREYLQSAHIDHGSGGEGPKDSIMKRYAGIYQKWKDSRAIQEWWLVNQSNMLEYQASRHKARGGACFYFCNEFLRAAEGDFMEVEALLGRYNRGDVGDVIRFEEEVQAAMAGGDQRIGAGRC